MIRHIGMWAGLGILMIACSSAESEIDDGASGDTADLRSEDLKTLPGNFSQRLIDNIVADDANHPEGFGVPDTKIPYPDTYWPFQVKNSSGKIIESDGIAFRWQGKDVPSALEKFMSVVSGGDAAKVEEARKWEHDFHGPGLGERQNREVQSWEGHCPGWTGAAMAHAPIKHPVFIKPSPSKKFVECSEADAAASVDGCTRFEIGDINALEAEIHVDGNQPLVGRGCFTKEPTLDEFDRVKRNPQGLANENGRGCKGLNPGALLAILGNRMKRDHLPFAINAQQPGVTDQIWNQPAYRYVVNSYEEITVARAIELVAENTQGTAAPSSYIWNRAAKGFVLVDISILWTKEKGPNKVFVSGKDSTRKHRVKMVIELDRNITNDAAARKNAVIVGGEYLSDPKLESNDGITFGPERLTVPTFVWISIDSGRDDLTIEEAGNPRFQHHNPFIKPSLVKRLVELGAK